MSQHDAERFAVLAQEAFVRFGETGSPAALEELIDNDAKALAAAPGHPEADGWRYRQTVAWRYRAGQTGSAADWDVAVRQANALRTAVADDALAAVEADGERALTLFLRFDSLVGGWTESELRWRHRELVEQVSELLSGPVQMMVLGLTALDRFLLDGDPADRAAGRGLLGSALPVLPDDEQLVPEALVEYAKALDAARLADGVDPAAAGQMRDEAIDVVDRARTLFTAEERPDLLLLDGELRCSRGDMTDDVAELTAGLQRLELFEQVADPDDADRGFALLKQALVHVRLWLLTDDPDERPAVVACCDAALAVGLSDEPALDAHKLVLEVESDRVDGPVSDAEQAAAHPRLDAASAALDEWPNADPGVRAELALTLAGLAAQLAGFRLDLARQAELLRIARDHPDPPEEWDTRLNLLDTLGEFTRRMLDGNLDFDALSELLGVWRRTGLPDLIGDRLATGAAILACFDATQTGDLARLQAARELLQQQSAPAADTGILLALVDAIEAHARARTDAERIAALRPLTLAGESQSGDPAVRQFLLPFLRATAAILGGWEPPALPVLPPDADPLGRMLGELNMAVTATASLMAAARRPDELHRRLATAECWWQGLAPDSPARVVVTGSLAACSLHLARSDPADPAAAAAAVRWGEAGMDMLGGPEHPLWSRHVMGLATAHRLRRAPGDLPESRRLGMAALRGHAWRVLLQAGTEHSLTAAGSTASIAAEVVDWCAADRATDDLVRAVEAGRGLALHAATTTRGLARMLVALGQPELADEWTAADGVDRQALPAAGGFRADIRGHLRRRVLRAVHAGDAAVLDPPEPVQITTALRRLEFDALVYLVPGTAAGRAIVVPAAGPIEVLDLPGLADAAVEPLLRYATAYRESHRSVRDVELPPTGTNWPDELDRVLRWAWPAAGAALLTAAQRCSAGPVPRLVLVPVGQLALVPWHAAVRDLGGQPRHLVEDAVLSYAASARLLCDLVERPPIEAGTAVVVGNPTGDLHYAGVEAEAVRAAFHPEATYLGTATGGLGRTHGSGTAAELLTGLADGSRPCPLLHLACHARAEPARPDRSHLLLAGGAPWEIRELLDRAPTAPLALDTVMLAACSTNVSGVDYDEAFSIATAFLAAGARSVVGSLWPVPDGPTALLMFMVHHFRQRDGLRLPDALRRAQLWMLDPDRVLPPTFPSELVAGQRPADAAFAQPVSWAGFTHLGR